jgi:hypothetical protein
MVGCLLDSSRANAESAFGIKIRTPVIHKNQFLNSVNIINLEASERPPRKAA